MKLTKFVGYTRRLFKIIGPILNKKDAPNKKR